MGATLWLCCWAINIHVERTDKEIEVQIQGMLIHNPEPPGILLNVLLVSLTLTSYTPQNQGSCLAYWTLVRRVTTSRGLGKEDSGWMHPSENC